MPALIHTCYRIGDIDRSVAFYEALGMKEMMRTGRIAMVRGKNRQPKTEEEAEEQEESRLVG